MRIFLQVTLSSGNTSPGRDWLRPSIPSPLTERGRGEVVKRPLSRSCLRQSSVANIEHLCYYARMNRIFPPVYLFGGLPSPPAERG